MKAFGMLVLFTALFTALFVMTMANFQNEQDYATSTIPPRDEIEIHYDTYEDLYGKARPYRYIHKRESYTTPEQPEATEPVYGDDYESLRG